MDMDGAWEIGLIDFTETHVEFILQFRPAVFPIDGFNDPFGRGIVLIR
jgi:hypothetical protein